MCFQLGIHEYELMQGLNAIVRQWRWQVLADSFAGVIDSSSAHCLLAAAATSDTERAKAELR